MTKQKWHPEVEVDVGLVKSLIEGLFTRLAPIKSIKHIGAGWDNSVFLINKRFVFRFPHRKIAGLLIENENRLLPNIANKTNLATPDLKFIGEANADYPYSFHGYEMIEGTSGCHAKLTKEERAASIVPLATFLKSLHSFDKALAMPCGAWPQVFVRSSPETLVKNLKETVSSFHKKGELKFDLIEYEREFKKALDINLVNEDKVVLHGDLYCRHLIFKDKKLSGIIDWGDNGVGLRAVDLAVLFTFYPIGYHEEFFAIYGKVSEETYSYARFVAIHSATNVLVYAQDIGDGLLFKEAANAIFRINDKLVEL